MGTFTSHSQIQNGTGKFNLKGRVEAKNTGRPISGVSISNNLGNLVVTNGLGEFEIRTKIGDILIIEHEDIETLRYNVKQNDDVLILVEDFETSSISSRLKSSPDISLEHQALLDSAEIYKDKNR